MKEPPKTMEHILDLSVLFGLLLVETMNDVDYSDHVQEYTDKVNGHREAMNENSDGGD